MLQVHIRKPEVIYDLYAFVHLSLSGWMDALVARVHPSALSTHNGLISPSCLPLSSPFFLLPSSLSLDYPECLIMAPAFREHVNMPAAPLAGAVVLLCADWLRGKGAWVAKEERVGGYHSPTG